MSSSYSRQPNAQMSLCFVYCCFFKNSGGEYSRVPKKVVTICELPAFWVDTLDEDREEQEEDASS